MYFNDNDLIPISSKDYKIKEEHKIFMNIILREFEEENVIEKTDFIEGGFVNSVFLVEKSNSTIHERKFRLILNMKAINENYIVHEKFKMESLNSCLCLIQENCYMASLDLKNAYHTIPIWEPHKKYLQFCVDDQFYNYKVLPQGYKDSPRIFTRVLKPVLSFLRVSGIFCSIYIDDLYIQGDSFIECENNVRVAYKVFRSLGFDISEKSSFIPSQSLSHLGFILNSVDMNVCLDDKKKNKIKKLGYDLLQTKKTSIRNLAKFIGTIVSCFPAVRYGCLFYRQLELLKISSLKENKGNFEYKIMLNKLCRDEILWWLNEGIFSFKPISENNPDFIIKSDSSNFAWGAVFKDRKTQGCWGDNEMKLHINVKELLAASLGIKALAHDLEDCHIQVKIDNTTAVCYINNMGGTHSVQCNDITKNLILWCKEKRIWLSACHIEGKNNKEADVLSRKINIEGEISLNPDIFKELCSIYGTPDIDLFASRVNNKLDKYMSRFPDSLATGVDAFKYKWSEFMFIFPPFILINRILAKILRDKPLKVMLIVPNWPTAVWYPKLMKMKKLIKHLGKASLISSLPKNQLKSQAFFLRLNLMICIC